MTDLSPSTEGNLSPEAVASSSQATLAFRERHFLDGRPLLAVMAALSVALALSVLFVHSRVVIAVAGLVLVGALMVRMPYLGLLAYVGVVFLRPEETGVLPMLLHVERVVAVTLMVAVALGALASRRPRLTASPLNWAVIGLLAVILMGVPFAFWRGGAFKAALEFAKLCFLYLAVVLLVTDMRRARGLLWLAMAIWAWHGASAWLGYHEGTSVYVGEADVLRAMGPTSRFGGANTLAYLLVVALSVIIVLFRAERLLAARIAMVVMGALCLGGALVTGSRSALLGLLFVGAIAVWRSRRRLVMGLALAVVITVGWLLTPSALQTRYRTIGSYASETTWLSRRQGWEVGARMFLERPIFGVGAGNFGAARHALYDSSWMNSHSVCVQTAAELGLPGVICFGALVWLIFRENRRLRKRLKEAGLGEGASYAYTLSLALDTALAALLFLGITGHNLYNPNYYLVAGLTVALVRITRDSVQSEEQNSGGADAASAG